MNPVLAASTVNVPKNDDEIFQLTFNNFDDAKYRVRAVKEAPFFSFRYTRAQIELDFVVTEVWLSNSDLIEKFANKLDEVQGVLSHFPRFMAVLLKDQIPACTKDKISEEALVRTIEVANRHLHEPNLGCYKKRDAIRTCLAGLGRSYILFTRHQKKQDRIIGGGATKTGKLALCMQTAKIHALLVCRKAYLSAPEEWDLVLNEVALLQELRGIPGVLQLHDSVVTADKIYMVTELFNCGDLEKVFLSNRVLSLGDKISIALQISMGLWNMQELNIVHRDLKPSNILVAITEEVIKAAIGDLGSACKRDHAAMIQTRTGSVAYMAPEKVKALETEGWALTSTFQADIWSLGLIFYSLFSDKIGTLMSFQNARDLQAAIVNLKSQEIEEELDKSEIYQPLLNIIKMMLQIDPIHRLTAKTVFKLLGSALNELPPELGGLKD